MSLSAELLDTAGLLNRAQPERQANLRRAVSTAYYALFHLIVESACANWPSPQRGKVARQFDHKRMKDVSDRIAKLVFRSTSAEKELCFVAATFVLLQEQRHEADYDLNAILSSSDVADLIGAVRVAFESWQRIKDEPATHEYLFSLLFKERS